MLRQLIPRLHVVTDDDILAQSRFLPTARALLERGIALHVRGHHTPASVLFQLADELSAIAGGLLIVNDRVDIALCARAHGVQLGERSLPVATARTLVGERLIGYSAHSATEAGKAQSDGADFILAGTIYPSESHPDAAPAGAKLIERCAGECSIPIIAIGGVTAERVPELTAAGAFGVAVIRSVWQAAEPVQAADGLLKLLGSDLKT